MFQNLKNKVFSTVANCLRPHLQEKQKEETVVVENTGTKVIQHGERYCSQDCKMTPEKAQELLKLSFQRGPEEFIITKPGHTGYAMDAESPDCQLAQKNMFGLNGAASSVIYSFFAKHGFIGWQLCAMLSQHWLINRACRLPNEDALANGWTLEWQKQDETLDDVEADKRAELLTLAVERGNQSFDLAEKALKFGINRSIYGQALAYFIIEGEDPSTPLNLDGIQPKSFKGITVVEPYWAFPDWGEDAMTPGSLNFYRPEFYTVGGKRIHRSRLCVKTFVEVPDILKPSYYFGGVPLTQMIYERTYAAEKTANEVPELALTKRMLVADANLEEAMANPQVLRQKMEILAHFRNNNGVYFKDRPESVTQLDTNLADLDANVWTQYQLVASVASIPADRLLCTSPKGFQSTGEYERKTYAQTLQAAYQEVAFREFLETALALILKSEFGVADPITLIFNPIDSPTEAERAQTQLVQANRDSALINAGIISAEEAREALAADKGSGYSNLPAEMPKSAEMPDLSDLFGNNEEDKPEVEENGGNGENGTGADTAADEWEESAHPRDDDGKFSSANGAHGTEQLEKNEKEVSSTGKGQTQAEFHSGEEGNSFFYTNPNYKKWFKSLSEVTKKIIKDYTLDRAADINAQLRENNLKGFYKKAVESIDSAISTFVLNEPIRVYRALEETLEEEVGELYKEEGYASTTCNKSAAEERSGLILVMDIPAGKGNGAYINELSHYKDKEYEFLIKRNSQFRVSGKEKKNGKTYIHMEMEN